MLILSPETEALIRARAETAGKTPDQVIRDAFAKDVGHPTKTEARSTTKAGRAEILAIAERSAARPLLYPRMPDEIIGYDDRGVPK